MVRCVFDVSQSQYCLDSWSFVSMKAFLADGMFLSINPIVLSELNSNLEQKPIGTARTYLYV